MFYAPKDKNNRNTKSNEIKFTTYMQIFKNVATIVKTSKQKLTLLWKVVHNYFICSFRQVVHRVKTVQLILALKWDITEYCVPKNTQDITKKHFKIFLYSSQVIQLPIHSYLMNFPLWKLTWRLSRYWCIFMQKNEENSKQVCFYIQGHKYEGVLELLYMTS